MVSLDFLKSVDLFKGLDEEQLRAVSQGCEEKKYLRGKKFFGDGEGATAIWIVVEGQVDLCFELPGRMPPEIITVATVSAGETFGWASFVPPHTYRFSAYGSGDICAVLKLEKKRLTALFEKDAGMGYRVLTNLAAVISSRFQQLRDSATARPYSNIKITVHMATCGIAAGARGVMVALMEELARSGRDDIQVETRGCLGRCSTEPNITVEIEGADPVIYQRMTPERMREVFDRHILKGEIQNEFVLPDGPAA